MPLEKTIGFTLALISGIFFGIYMAPRKTSKLSASSFMWLMGLSVGLFAYLIHLISGGKNLIQFYDISLSMLCGILWFIGSIAYSEGVRIVGLTRSTPIKNLGVILVTFYGVLIFSEFDLTQPIPLIAAIAGSVLMAVSAIFLGNLTARSIDSGAAFNSSISPEDRKKLVVLGNIWSIIGGLAFSCYSIPMKAVFRNMQGQAYFHYRIDALAWLSVMGLTIALCSVIYYAFRNPNQLIPKLKFNKEWLYGGSAGLFWVLAAACSSIAMTKISMSVSWPITNLSTLWGVALGIWYYREIKISQHKWETLWGMLATAAGVALLAYATSYGKV